MIVYENSIKKWKKKQSNFENAVITIKPFIINQISSLNDP